MPLEDVGGTLGEDGGSREDYSLLGVCSRRLNGGASNYTRDVPNCADGRASGPPNRISSFKDHTRCNTGFVKTRGA